MSNLPGEQVVAAARQERPLARSFSSPELCSTHSSMNTPTTAYTAPCSEDGSEDEYTAANELDRQEDSIELSALSLHHDSPARSTRHLDAGALAVCIAVSPVGNTIAGACTADATADALVNERPVREAPSSADRPARFYCKRPTMPMVTTDTPVILVPTLASAATSPTQLQLAEPWHSWAGAAHPTDAVSTTPRKCGAAQRRELDSSVTASASSSFSLVVNGGSLWDPLSKAQEYATVAAAPPLSSEQTCTMAIEPSTGTPQSPSNSAATFVDYGAEDGDVAQSEFSCEVFELSQRGSAWCRRASRDGLQRTGSADGLGDAALSSRGGQRGVRSMPSFHGLRASARLFAGPDYTAEYAIAVSEAAKYRWTLREMLAACANVAEDDGDDDLSDKEDA